MRFLRVTQIVAGGSLEPGQHRHLAKCLEQVSPLSPAAVQLSLFTQQQGLQVVCIRPCHLNICALLRKRVPRLGKRLQEATETCQCDAEERETDTGR